MICSFYSTYILFKNYNLSDIGVYFILEIIINYLLDNIYYNIFRVGDTYIFQLLPPCLSKLSIKLLKWYISIMVYYSVYKNDHKIPFIETEI